MIQCDLAGFSFRRLGALSSLVVLSLFSRFRVALLSLFLPFYGAFMALLWRFYGAFAVRFAAPFSFRGWGFSSANINFAIP